MASDINAKFNSKYGTAVFEAINRDHTPSWKASGSGFSRLAVYSHLKNPYLMFTSTEISSESGDERETAIHLDAEEGRALYDFLHKLYSREATDDPA